MSPRRPSLEELNAYLDGELDEARRCAVEAHLQDCPEDAERIAAYRHRDMLLRAAFHELPPARLPESIDLTLRARRRTRRLAGIGAVAAMLAGLVVGILFATGWLTRQPDSGRALAALDQHATAAYLLNAPAQSVISLHGESPTRIGQRLSLHVGRRVWVPDLSRFGYRLVAARVLEGGPTPAAQLLFRDAAGHRISCYFAAQPETGETALHYSEAHGIKTFSRFDEGLGYAVSGTIERSALRTLAVAAYEEGEKESTE